MSKLKKLSGLAAVPYNIFILASSFTSQWGGRALGRAVTVFHGVYDSIIVAQKVGLIFILQQQR